MRLSGTFKVLVGLVIVVFLGISFEALAQITNNLGQFQGQELTVQSVFNIFRGLSCWFIRFAIIVLGIMMLVYGLLFFKSRGNSTEFTNARKALTWGIVGGLVIMGVFTIILTIPALLGSLTGQAVDYPILLIFANCV